VLVTPGTSPAMLLLFGHLLDPGDEVVLGDPYYACYPNFIRYAEGRLLTVTTSEANGFALEPAAVRARMTPRTRAVLINSPANPTGAVMRDDAMAGIAEVAGRAGAVVVSDEIYHGLVYEGRERSILEFTDQAFVLNGFSKAFAMTGYRLGYVVGPAKEIRALQTLFGNFFISTNEFVQWAGVAALREAADESARFRSLFAERRRVMIDGVRRIGLGVGFEPTGAFYVLANARAYTADSTRFAMELLEEARSVPTPRAISASPTRRRWSGSRKGCAGSTAFSARAGDSQRVPVLRRRPAGGRSPDRRPRRHRRLSPRRSVLSGLGRAETQAPRHRAIPARRRRACAHDGRGRARGGGPARAVHAAQGELRVPREPDRAHPLARDSAAPRGPRAA
jgi:histidinol-phosphate/aromatic aminotransferase/cobyric acid decarboxylase-like protein